MKIGLKILLNIIILSVVLLAAQNETYIIYENGMDAYRKGQYNLAVQEFETILSNNWESPELYYNLGNAFYRSGKIAGAVWAYESCLKLSPNHENARYNLKLTNLKVVDKVDLPDPPFYLKWYLSFKERFTPASWINISLFILLLNAFMLSAIKLTQISVLSKFQGALILSLIHI